MGHLVSYKALEFAVRAVRLNKFLCEEKQEFVMSRQLLRSATSIGANLSEAEYAQSTNDFINKNSIALKEAAESDYWLELLYKTDFLTKKQYESLNKDCEELIKMLTSIIKTTKSNNRKPY